MTTVANTHQKAMEPAATPGFGEELSTVWGADWGASDEVGRLRRVVVREPGNELAVVDRDAWDPESQALVDPEGQWYWTDREPPQLARLREQQNGLAQALRAEGVDVEALPPMDAQHTKAMYVRDPFVLTPNGAIIGRMGVRMRRGEEPEITRRLAALGVPIIGTIMGEGTLEGGSYLKLRPDLHLLGTSIRCNQDGAAQLRRILNGMGIELHLVPIPGWSIHLDLHLAVVDSDRVLVDTERLPYDLLVLLAQRGFELIEADSSEPWGINLLCLAPGRVLMAEGNPANAGRLRAHDVEVMEIPFDEVQKNGGGIHCSTNELIRDPA